jgi:hypothetical protein
VQLGHLGRPLPASEGDPELTEKVARKVIHVTTVRDTEFVPLIARPGELASLRHHRSIR